MDNIIMYSSPTCTKCVLAKQHLDSKGVSYETRDITKPAYRKEAMTLGVMSLPSIRKGDSIVIGFNPTEIDKLINT